MTTSLPLNASVIKGCRGRRWRALTPSPCPFARHGAVALDVMQANQATPETRAWSLADLEVADGIVDGAADAGAWPGMTGFEADQSSRLTPHLVAGGVKLRVALSMAPPKRGLRHSGFRLSTAGRSRMPGRRRP